jgi:hypothetical protein
MWDYDEEGSSILIDVTVDDAGRLIRNCHLSGVFKVSQKR